MFDAAYDVFDVRSHIHGRFCDEYEWMKILLESFVFPYVHRVNELSNFKLPERSDMINSCENEISNSSLKNQ